jgi:hypothetical protein
MHPASDPERRGLVADSAHGAVGNSFLAGEVFRGIRYDEQALNDSSAGENPLVAGVWINNPSTTNA